GARLPGEGRADDAADRPAVGPPAGQDVPAAGGRLATRRRDLVLLRRRTLPALPDGAAGALPRRRGGRGDGHERLAARLPPGRVGLRLRHLPGHHLGPRPGLSGVADRGGDPRDRPDARDRHLTVIVVGTLRVPFGETAHGV